MLEDVAGAIHTDGESQPIPQTVEHPSRRLQSLLMWTLYYLIVWQYCHLISDNALLMLLRFFKAFLVCIGSIIPNGAGADLVLSLAALLPMTMYSLRNFLGIERDNFERYVYKVYKVIQTRRLPTKSVIKFCQLSVSTIKEKEGVWQQAC